MNWTLNDDSLFAILLRSSWWISFAIAGAVSAIAIALLPEALPDRRRSRRLPVPGHRMHRRVEAVPGAVSGPHRPHARRGSCDVVGRIFRAPSKRHIGGKDTESAQ